MKYVKIEYAGSILEMPDWLAYMWPYDLPIEQFPFFCGAGRGIGDWVVPDHLHGAHIAPACLVHDIEWIMAPDTYLGFQGANNRLYRNLVAQCNAQLTGSKLAMARVGCVRYWLAVSTIGYKFFAPDFGYEEYPADNKEIQVRLRKLAMARLNTV